MWAYLIHGDYLTGTQVDSRKILRDNSDCVNITSIYRVYNIRVFFVWYGFNIFLGMTRPSIMRVQSRIHQHFHPNDTPSSLCSSASIKRRKIQLYKIRTFRKLFITHSNYIYYNVQTRPVNPARFLVKPTNWWDFQHCRKRDSLNRSGQFVLILSSR